MRSREMELSQLCLVLLTLVCARGASAATDVIVAGLTSGDPKRVNDAVASIRVRLTTDCAATVDRLNEEWMVAMMSAGCKDAVVEFAVTGTLGVPADTWRIEQLQRHRVRALLEMKKSKEALGAAKGLFNVSGIGFTPTALEILSDALKVAQPEYPGIVSRFKLQQLAGAMTDKTEREKHLKELGESVIAGIAVDAGPWEKAIKEGAGKEEYRQLYGLGNLLLLAGRADEAFKVFQKVRDMASPAEIRYASEGFAKAMKARDGIIGPANAWIFSVRPKQ